MKVGSKKSGIVLFCIVCAGLIIFVIYSAFFGQQKKIARSPIWQGVQNIVRPTAQIDQSTIEPHLGLKQIFSDDHSWVASLAAEKKLTLIATGDVIPARVTNFRAAVELHDFLWPWRKTAEVLKSADITLINLESPLFAGCPATRQSTFVFCGEAKHVEGMLFAGVDVASLANNHAGNFGNEGIGKTEEILKNAGITSFGISDPVYRTFKGVKFAFLGYNDVGVEIDLDRMAAEIKEARKNAEIVVVEYHWGTEYITPPEARQIEIGHLAIDSGADLVVGNHPHWIKPIELYQGKLITYGHGNFIFDQEWSEKTKEGVVGRYVFYDKKLVDVEYLPVKIMDFGQPYFLEGSEKEKILSEMASASAEVTKLTSYQPGSNQ